MERPKIEIPKPTEIPDFVLSDQQISTFFEGLAMVNTVALDTESSGADLRDSTGHVIGFSVAFRPVEVMEPFSAYFPVRHVDFNYDRTLITSVMRGLQGKTLVMHNAKHDLVALDRMGFPWNGPFMDTMLMAHMVDENLPNKSLDYLARRFTGEHKERSRAMQAFIDAFGWEFLPAEMVAEYGEHDALITLLLFEYLTTFWKREGLEVYWDKPEGAEFTRVLAEIERTGVRIDSDFINSEIAKGRFLMEDIADTLGLNPASTKELGELLLERLHLPVVKETPAGRPSFDKKTMETYDELLSGLGNPVADHILSFRGWQKVVSSTYEPLLQLVSSDGRVRPNFKIHGTVTGRLSCERPNLQQIPRSSTHDWNGGTKRAFIADPGWALINFDYKNLEFRLAAAYANQPELLSIFNSGRDVFSEMALSLGMSRQDTKTLVYTIMFGGGVARISAVFNVDQYRARDILEGFYQRYPELRKASRTAQNIVDRKAKIQLWSGRYRHFDNPSRDAHKAWNSMIQGGAADIVKRQLVRVHRALDPSEARIVLTVHDSLVIEIKTDRVDALVPDIRAIMETVIPDFGVKFEVEVEPWQ